MGLDFLSAGAAHAPSETLNRLLRQKLLQTIIKMNECSTLFNLIREHMQLPSLSFMTDKEINKQVNGGKSLQN